MHVATREGLNLNVVRLGTRGAFPPLVLAHPLFGNLAMWYLTIAPALAESREVVLYDLRGHGLSERAADGYDVQTMSGDLERLIDSLDEAQVDLAGHSYGGTVALAYAMRVPERVRRLAVIEAPLVPAQIDGLAGLLGITHGNVNAVLAKVPLAMKFLLKTFGKRSQTRYLATLENVAKALPPDFLESQIFSDEQLAALALPVLALYGTRSGCRESGERLARVLPSCRLEELEAGHYLPQEAPADTLGALQRFFGADS